MENHTWDLNSVEVVHTQQSETLTPAQRWRLQEFGQTANSGNAADDADPDGDGFSNLMERALGWDPDNANPGSPLTLAIESITGSNYWTATIDRSAFASDITFIPESSMDLVEWNQIGIEVMEESSSQLKIRETSPSGNSDKRFFRLRILEN